MVMLAMRQRFEIRKPKHKRDSKTRLIVTRSSTVSSRDEKHLRNARIFCDWLLYHHVTGLYLDELHESLNKYNLVCLDPIVFPLIFFLKRLSKDE